MARGRVNGSGTGAQYYGENYARLIEVKTKYDPHNLFHNPQSIPPRRGFRRPTP